MELITLYLVRLSDGMIVDQKAFHNDYINLAHNSGVFLYDDLLAVLSVRFQCVHIFQVRCCCF
jgi:de-etiolated-1